MSWWFGAGSQGGKKVKNDSWFCSKQFAELFFFFFIYMEETEEENIVLRIDY